MQEMGTVHQLRSEGGFSPSGSHMFAVDAGFWAQSRSLNYYGSATAGDKMSATSWGFSTWQAWPVFNSLTHHPQARPFLANGSKNAAPGILPRHNSRNGRNVSLPIVGKTNRVLKAAQTEIT